MPCILHNIIYCSTVYKANNYFYLPKFDNINSLFFMKAVTFKRKTSATSVYKTIDTLLDREFSLFSFNHRKGTVLFVRTRAFRLSLYINIIGKYAINDT